MKYLQQAWGRQNPRLGRQERWARAKRAGSLSKTDFDELVKSSYLKSLETTAVCCFTSKVDSILFWSHYADSHSGVCFEFEENLVHPLFFSYEVEYVDDRPFVVWDGELNESIFRSLVLKKSTEWSYECERRMVEPRFGPGVREFPAHSLKALYLGCRIVPSSRQRAIDFFRASRPGLPIFQAQPSDDAFKLGFSQLA
jgi:hypothetical protein